MQPEEPAEPAFQFEGFIVESASFEHVARAEREDGEKRPGTVGCAFSPSGQLTINDEIRRAELRLNVEVRPDPKWQPYRVSVAAIGRFAMTSGRPEDFRQFLRQGAAPILFPYVREVIDRITSDGRYGRVRLNPINIAAMMLWGMEESTSNEPQLPSAQSPSSSQQSEPQP